MKGSIQYRVRSEGFKDFFTLNEDVAYDVFSKRGGELSRCKPNDKKRFVMATLK